MILAVACLFAGCGKGREKAPGPGAVPAASAVFGSPAATVLSAQAGIRQMRMRFDDTLEAPVRIEIDARRSFLVSAPAAGRLEAVRIRSRDQAVKAGEPLAYLSSPEFVTAQREFLLLDGKADAGLLGKAESRLLQMGMTPGQFRSIRATGKPIDRIAIVSPRAGFVVSAGGQSAGGAMAAGAGASPGGTAGTGGGDGMGMGGPTGGANAPAGSGSATEGLKVGAYLERGAPVALVNDLSVVAASLALPADLAGLFREGDSVHLDLPSLGYSAMARLDYLEAGVSDSTRTLTAKAYLPNPGWKLNPGTLGKAHLVPRQDSVWALPRSAVLSLGGKWIVWARSLADSTAFQAQEVRLGRIGPRYAEVVRGLAPDQVVAQTASLLLDRDAVVTPLALPDSFRDPAPPLHDESHEGHAAVAEPPSVPDPHSGHKPQSETAAPSGHPAGHAGAGAKGESAATLTLSPEKEILAGIISAKAAISPLAPSLTYRATTRYDDRSMVRVPSRVEGTVGKAGIHRVGERVEQGRVLAVIRSDALLSAQQEFLLAVSQARSLPDQAMSGAQIQAARRRLQVMGMGQSQIAAVLKTGQAEPGVSILSPAAGILLQIDAREGQYVRAGASLFTLGVGERIWVETWMLPEEALAYPEGSEAWVELEGGTGEPIPGRLEHKQQEAAVSGSLAIAHIGIPNPGGRIPAGRQAWVSLRQKAREALNIPASALLESGSETMVWLRTAPHEFAPRMVKTGLRTPAAVEIFSGLEPGEEVVVSGAYLLNSEWVVRQGAGMRHAGH